MTEPITTFAGEQAKPPVAALARSVRDVPAATSMPGGARFEPKWDGFRMLIIRDGSDVTLWSRQRKSLTAAFPEIVAAAGEQLPPGLILDGEAVIWSKGRLSFDALQSRNGASRTSAARLARDMPASFVAFDVLAFAFVDTRPLPFDDRRTILESLAGGWRPPLTISPMTEDRDLAVSWIDDMATAGIEGVVVKGGATQYRGGQRDWAKVKRMDPLDVVVAAAIGPLQHPSELIVGVVVDGVLRIAGRSKPLQPAESSRIGKLLRPASTGHPWPPVVSPGAMSRFPRTRDPVHLTLVEPVVAEVRADAARTSGSFRHAVKLVRVRPDLPVPRFRRGR